MTYNVHLLVAFVLFASSVSAVSFLKPEHLVA